jgi:hypothetical protein
LEVVNVHSTREKPKSENAKREQVERVDDKDAHVQEAKGAESGDRGALGLEDNRGGQRDKFQEKEQIREGQIRGRLVEIQFVNRPDREADQPHAAAGTNEQPESADARAGCDGVSKRQNSRGGDQGNLQEIPDGGEGEAIWKQ